MESYVATMGIHSVTLSAIISFIIIGLARPDKMFKKPEEVLKCELDAQVWLSLNIIII